MTTSKSSNKFKQTRTRFGLSVVDMARLMGVHRQTYGKWERGESPPNATTNRLLDVLIEVGTWSRNGLFMGWLTDKFVEKPKKEGVIMKARIFTKSIKANNRIDQSSRKMVLANGENGKGKELHSCRFWVGNDVSRSQAEFWCLNEAKRIGIDRIFIAIDAGDSQGTFPDSEYRLVDGEYEFIRIK
jgi:DNA-binding XRE family transcriptional regulator